MVIRDGHLNRAHRLRYRRLHVMPRRSSFAVNSRNIAAAIEIEFAVTETQHLRTHVLGRILIRLQVLYARMDGARVGCDAGPDFAIGSDVANLEIGIFGG